MNNEICKIAQFGCGFTYPNNLIKEIKDCEVSLEVYVGEVYLGTLTSPNTDITEKDTN